MRSLLKLPLLLTLLGACSLINDPADHQAGGMDAGEDAGPSVTSTEYCARFAELVCEANMNCCDDRDVPFMDCERVLTQECGELHGPRPMLSEFLTFDGVRAAEALESLELLTNACDTEIVFWSLEDYLSPLIGRRAPLAECGPAALTVRAIIHAAVSCDRSSDGAAVCQATTGNRWQCETRRDEPRPCYLGAQCLSNRCEPSMLVPGLFPGTCGDGLADGEVCQPGRSDQCISLVCEDAGVAWRCTERTQERVYCRAN